MNPPGDSWWLPQVHSDQQLLPKEHGCLLEEACERNQASASLHAGVDTLTRGPPLQTEEQTQDVTPTNNQSPKELLATIAELHEKLGLLPVSYNNRSLPQTYPGKTWVCAEP